MRALVVIALLVALLLAVLSIDGPRPRADIVISQRSDAFTLDPQRMSWQQDMRLATGLYEGLVRSDPTTGEPAPGVAERWEISPDGRTYTFHLRDRARWSNGDPVVAEDFVYAWRRALLPDTAADYSGFLMGIEGASEFFDWRTQQLAKYAARTDRDMPAATALWKETERRFRDTVGLSAPDPHTLVIRLRQPIPFLLDLMSFAPLNPVHRATVDAHARLDAETGRVVQDHAWTKPGRLVTNGPYIVTSWRYKRDMLLERNPHFWDPSSAIANSIEIRIIDDANTTVLAAESGAVDWVTEVLVDYRPDLLEERARYEQHHRAALDAALARGQTIDEALAALPPPEKGERRNVHGLPAFGTDFYSFNCRPTLASGDSNPFADARVRRAFALAVDRTVLVTRVTRLGEPPSNVLTPRGSIPGYQSPAGLPFDPKRARRELADAGWVDRNGDGIVEDAAGSPFPTIDLLYSTGNPRFRDLTFALRDMWQDTLGVRIQARGKESKDFSSELREGRFMIARGSWYGDFGDPTTWLDISRVADGNNDRKYENPRYDALLDAAAAERDQTRRFEILSEAERLLVEEDLPMVPICTLVTVYMYEPGALGGMTHRPRLNQQLGALQPRGAWVRKDGRFDAQGNTALQQGRE